MHYCVIYSTHQSDYAKFMCLCLELASRILDIIAQYIIVTLDILIMFSDLQLCSTDKLHTYYYGIN